MAATRLASLSFRQPCYELASVCIRSLFKRTWSNHRRSDHHADIPECRFYPQSALPAALQPWLGLSPLSVVVEQSRATLIRGETSSWNYVIWGTLLICEISYRLF